MNAEQIKTELSDCKTTDRHIIDVKGDRFWVFGIPTGSLLVRRVVDGIRKPLRTMEYDEIAYVEPIEKPTDSHDKTCRAACVGKRPGGVLAIRDDIKAAVYVERFAYVGFPESFRVTVYFSPYRNQMREFETRELARVYARSAADHNGLEIVEYRQNRFDSK